MNENSYSDTDLLKSRSSAVITEVWACNLSASSDENGTCGSGGIVGGRKDEMTARDWFECRETRRPAEFLRTRTSSDEPLSGVWSWSASNTCEVGDSWTAAQVESDLGGVGLRSTGGSGDAIGGVSTGDAPPGPFPDA